MDLVKSSGVMLQRRGRRRRYAPGAGHVQGPLLVQSGRGPRRLQHLASASQSSRQGAGLGFALCEIVLPHLGCLCSRHAVCWSAFSKYTVDDQPRHRRRPRSEDRRTSSSARFQGLGSGLQLGNMRQGARITIGLADHEPPYHSLPQTSRASSDGPPC